MKKNEQLQGSFWKSKIAWVLSFLLGVTTTYATNFFGEKGKNLATKQDIQEITRIVKSVENEIGRLAEIDKTKYNLKYEAIKKSLIALDGYFSYTMKDPKGREIVKQDISTIELRKIHNELILSCDNSLIVERFLNLIFYNKIDSSKKHPTTLLNEYRNLARKELGFGDTLILSRDTAWIGRVIK